MKVSEMEILAHSLSAAAAAIVVKKTSLPRIPVGWTAFWATFPDLLAFGPMITLALFLRLAGNSETAGGHGIPHAHIGLPLYAAGHSLIVFALVFSVSSIAARRAALGLLGWLLHILIDIPTHSFSYYATRFLWPVSDYRIDGIAWWTPWFWMTTYGVLALVYVLLWSKGWLTGARVHSGS
jgi:hypothetical protein